MRYYFAYGMNTNLKEMSHRCGQAELVGQVVLPNYKFVFRHHADVEPSQGYHVVGVLWRITPDCERALDALEGYPFYYEKKDVLVETFEGEEINGMTHFVSMMYYMTDKSTVCNPSKQYYDCLVEGYTDNNISIDQIQEAIITE